MNQFGKEGVSALKAATPSRSGETAASWDYEVTRTGENWKITWTNSTRNNGVNIASSCNMVTEPVMAGMSLAETTSTPLSGPYSTR